MVRGRLAIVGASLAGLRAAEAARAAGFDGPITLVGEEPHLPYDRPPLSKAVLSGERAPSSVTLCDGAMVERLDLDLQLETRALGLDLGRRRLRLSTGELEWAGLVIATGCKPRTLPGGEGLGGVFVLRSLDDAVALREALGRATKVVIVGAGFIGGEVAACARALGLEVTILEALATPLATAIGPELGELYRRFHSEHGTEVRCGVTVDGFEGNGRVEAVRLAGGERVDADVVVVGIGVRPSVAWLEGTGLALEAGIACDAALQAAPGIAAAGDVARWLNPRYGVAMRVEHWTNAAEQGVHAARNLVTGQSLPYDAVPYFWSDQYGLKLQFAGRAPESDELIVLAAGDAGIPAVGLYGRQGRLAAALTLGSPPTFARLRLLLQRGSDLADAVGVARAAGFESPLA